jgi:hypothetical protein
MSGETQVGLFITTTISISSVPMIAAVLVNVLDALPLVLEHRAEAFPSAMQTLCLALRGWGYVCSEVFIPTARLFIVDPFIRLFRALRDGQ